MARYWTADTILRQAALELGLGIVDGALASPDAAIQQLVGLLSSLGQRLVHEGEDSWAQLRAEWNFITQAGDTGIYPVPDDFHQPIDETAWDQSVRLPLGGPLTPQEWAALKAWKVNLSVTALYKIDASELILWPQPPPVGKQISLWYISSSWVTPKSLIVAGYNYKTAGANGTDTPEDGADVCLFDPLLLVAGLKYEFRKAKRLDYGIEKIEYDAALARAKSSANPQRVIHLDGHGINGPGTKLIDTQNVPFTGIGK